jgi:DNA helicase HerA-like ATPase
MEAAEAPGAAATSSGAELLGYVVDGATPRSLRFVSPRPPIVGDYIVVEAEPRPVLGLVRSVGTRSITLSSLPGVYDPVVVERLRAESSKDDVFFECSATIVGDAESLEMPRMPPLPGSRVYRAPPETLARVFGGSMPRQIRVGSLLARPEVPVYVDVNMMVTRHTAVLAVTGAGKSNTVAVVADQLARIGGTLVVFDFHGEYVGSSIGGGVNVIEARLNPRLLSIGELMVLLGIEHRFYNQERVLRRALDLVAQKKVQRGFLEELEEAVEKLRGLERRREESTAAVAVLNKIETLRERYGDIVDDNAADPVTRIQPGRVNVVDLSRVDEDAADVVVSHMLRVILAERKKHKHGLPSRVPYPVLLVLEEAHILAPREDETLSKYWLARVAREGRKFGVGLMLVSQRPKGLDPDILSQMNNMIVLRIVEPSDQRYIQEASESLSSDLVEQLPGLNTGEAILVGPFVRAPALVKIDRFRGRLGGGDPDVVEEWTRLHEQQAPEPSSLYEDML